jgi:hypothetical protein
MALKRFYNPQTHNNGRLFLSQRDAVAQVGSHHNQIARWFRELIHYGFIVQTAGGGLGLDGTGIAPHWRLTELGYMGDQPTRDYRRWDGRAFQDSKTKARAGKPARSVLEIQHGGVRENQHSSGRKRAGNPAHRAGDNCAGNPAHNYLPLGSGSKAQPRAHDAASQPASPAAELPKASPELLATLRPVDPFAVDDDLSIPSFLVRRHGVAR